MITKSYSVNDRNLMRDRPYYKRIPRHILFLPDGMRRYAAEKQLDYMQTYDIAQKKCQDLLEVCLNEFGMDIVTIFFFRPTSFSEQKRTEKNLEAMMIAINKLANNILNGRTRLDASKTWIEAVSLSGRDWMAKPKMIQNSRRLSLLWDELKSTLLKSKEKRGNKKRKIIFLLNYSGKAEIDGVISGRKLQIPEQIGLMVRTGDGMRLSDCPLYALSSAHLHLIKKYLPLVTKADFRRIISLYYTKYK